MEGRVNWSTGVCAVRACHHSITPPVRHSILPNDHRPTEICGGGANLLDGAGGAFVRARSGSGLPTPLGAVKTVSLFVRARVGGSGADHDVRFGAGTAAVSRVAGGAGVRRNPRDTG